MRPLFISSLVVSLCLHMWESQGRTPGVDVRVCALALRSFLSSFHVRWTALEPRCSSSSSMLFGLLTVLFLDLCAFDANASPQHRRTSAILESSESNYCTQTYGLRIVEKYNLSEIALLLFRAEGLCPLASSPPFLPFSFLSFLLFY